jgi:hypothetical protein
MIGMVVVSAFARERRNGGICGDHRDLMTNQIGGERGQLILLSVRPAVSDHYILSLDVAGIKQSLLIRRYDGEAGPLKPACQKTDHRHHRLPRVRCKRPRSRRATDKRDELASFQSIEWHSVPRQLGPDRSISNYEGSVSGIAGRRIITGTHSHAGSDRSLLMLGSNGKQTA